MSTSESESPGTTDSSPSLSLQPASSPPWWRDPSRVAAIVGAVGLRVQEAFTGRHLIEEWTLALTLVAALSGAKTTSAVLAILKRVRGRSGEQKP